MAAGEADIKLHKPYMPLVNNPPYRVPIIYRQTCTRQALGVYCGHGQT